MEDIEEEGSSLTIVAKTSYNNGYDNAVKNAIDWLVINLGEDKIRLLEEFQKVMKEKK